MIKSKNIFSNFIKKYPHWALCLLVIFSALIYWGLWASDRYVSKANVVLESPQISSPKLDFSSIISGGGNNNTDMLLLRDYLLSTDMLKILVEKAKFREHYSNNDIDFFSKLSDANAPLEELYDYYRSMVSVELDDYAGVLRLEVEAFSPEQSYVINNLLLESGESFMNALGNDLANEQVDFLEKQVSSLKRDFESTRKSLLEYQNENNLVSPVGKVENLSSVVASLESQLASLKAQRNALKSYQSNTSPQVVKVNSQIKALSDQIDYEQSRLTDQSGVALNTLSSDYQALLLKAQFAQETYSSALSALENTRIEAARKLKQVSVLQTPTLPEYSTQPNRIYNITVVILFSVFVSLIIGMISMIIKDHRD